MSETGMISPSAYGAVPDSREPLRITVWGPPRTKKTSNVLARAGKRMVVLPSKAWTRWAKGALITVPARGLMGPTAPHRPFVHSTEWDEPCAVWATFYRDANRGDLVGYMQGLADLLEQRKIIDNDRWIVSWDGTRMLVDRVHPRVEVFIQPWTETCQRYLA